MSTEEEKGALEDRIMEENTGVSEDEGVFDNKSVSEGKGVSEDEISRVSENERGSEDERVSVDEGVSGNKGVSDDKRVSEDKRVSDDEGFSDNETLLENIAVSTEDKTVEEDKDKTEVTEELNGADSEVELSADEGEMKNDTDEDDCIIKEDEGVSKEPEVVWMPSDGVGLREVEGDIEIDEVSEDARVVENVVSVKSEVICTTSDKRVLVFVNGRVIVDNCVNNDEGVPENSGVTKLTDVSEDETEGNMVEGDRVSRLEGVTEDELDSEIGSDSEGVASVVDEVVTKAKGLTKDVRSTDSEEETVNEGVEEGGEEVSTVSEVVVTVDNCRVGVNDETSEVEGLNDNCVKKVSENKDSEVIIKEMGISEADERVSEDENVSNV